jgi:hypothetical protein
MEGEKRKGGRKEMEGWTQRNWEIKMYARNYER